MASIETLKLSKKERQESPVSEYRQQTRSKVSKVLERGKEVVKDGVKESFSWALVFGIFSGTVNLILGNPAYFVPTVLSHMGVGAVGGFGVGSIMNLIRGRKKR